MPDQTRVDESEFRIIRTMIMQDVQAHIAGQGDEALAERLRRFEENAGELGLEPQTVQVIRSDRRLVDDEGGPAL